MAKAKRGPGITAPLSPTTKPIKNNAGNSNIENPPNF